MDHIKEKLDIHDLCFQSQEDRLIKLEKLLLDGGNEIENGKPENEMIIWKTANSKKKLEEYEQCLIDHCGYLVKKGSDQMIEHKNAFHKNVDEDQGRTTRIAFMDDRTFDEIMSSWFADLKGKRPRPGSKKAKTVKKMKR